MKHRIITSTLVLFGCVAQAQTVQFLRVLDRNDQPLNGRVEVCRGGTFKVGFDPKELEKKGCANPASFTIDIVNVTDPKNEKVTFTTISSSLTALLTMDTEAFHQRHVRTRTSCGGKLIQSNTEVVFLTDIAAPSVSSADRCVGSAFTLTASPAPGSGVTYTWSGLNAPAFGNISVSGHTMTATGHSPGDYTVAVSVGSGIAMGCATNGGGSGLVRVRQSAIKPVIAAVGGAVCEGITTTQLSLNNSCPGTVNWNNNTLTGSPITVNPAQTTTYVATCSTSGICVSGAESDPAVVTVNPLVKVSVISIDVDPNADASVYAPGPLRGRTYGPQLAQIKGELNPTDALNGPEPRTWTLVANPCPEIASQVFGVHFQLKGPDNTTYSFYENSQPWVIFFNSGIATYWTINDPYRGISSGIFNTTNWPAGNYQLAVTLYDRTGVQGDPLNLPKYRTIDPAATMLGSPKVYNFTVGSSGARMAAAEPAPQLQVQTWPNPATDYLTVEVPTLLNQPVALRLTDQQGRTVYSHTAQATSLQHRETIDLRETSTGLYILQVEAGSLNQAVKVLKNSR
jgi:hypothetical protein